MDEVDVLLVQYNPEWDKLVRTIDSIIMQKGIKINLVISDDGSDNNLFDKIENYIIENGTVESIKLLEKQENKGTVQNILDGLKYCNSKYVKLISPGDMLYKEDTLRILVDFMDQKCAKISFGRMAFYSMDNSSFNIFAEQRPYLLKPFVDDTVGSIKSMMIYEDGISGASCFWETNYCKETILMISDSVKYMEDVVLSYVKFSGETIYFWDNFIVWYEYASGISTNGNEKWKKILENDASNYYSLLRKKAPYSFVIRRAYLLRKVKSKYLKLILFPDRFLYQKIFIGLLKDNPDLPNKDYLNGNILSKVQFNTVGKFDL